MTIPDWAREKAKALVRWDSINPVDGNEMQKAIAQALSDAGEAEREACAKVAENLPPTHFKIPVREAIAQAIRRRREGR